MRGQYALALVSIGILWTGRLLPEAPPRLLDWAFGGYLLLLSSWLLFLSPSAWTGPASLLGTWNFRFLPMGVGLGVVAFGFGGVGYVLSQREFGFSPVRLDLPIAELCGAIHCGEVTRWRNGFLAGDAVEITTSVRTLAGVGKPIPHDEAMGLPPLGGLWAMRL